MSLPEGWKLSTIGEACEILAGYGFPKHLQGRQQGDFPFYKVGDISQAWLAGSINLNKANNYVLQDEAKGLKAKLFPVGTTVLAKIGEAIKLNRRAMLSRPSLVDNNVMGIFPKTGKADAKYIFYFLLTVRLGDFSQATTVPSVRKSDVSEIPLPLAPLENQKIIVAEIEKQFSRLDEAVTALKRIQANLKRYKAAVLKAAVEGVGKDWWQPIQNTIRTLEQGWSPQCEREAAQDSETWAVIKTTAVQAGSFLEGKNKKLPEKLQPRPNLEIQKDDLLITRAGPRGRVGVTCLVRSTRPRLMVCDKVYRLRCNKQVVHPDYLEMVLNTPQIVDALDELKTGISDSGVNLTQVRFNKLLVPLPSLKEQISAIEEMERQLSVTEELEATIEINLKRVERLRRTILMKAFSGGMS